MFGSYTLFLKYQNYIKIPKYLGLDALIYLQNITGQKTELEIDFVFLPDQTLSCWAGRSYNFL